MDYTQLKTAIERFGEMLEVAWKTCKRHLGEEGFTEAATGSPKSIMRLAAQRNLIADLEKWFGYLRLRLISYTIVP